MLIPLLQRICTDLETFGLFGDALHCAAIGKVVIESI